MYRGRAFPTILHMRPVKTQIRCSSVHCREKLYINVGHSFILLTLTYICKFNDIRRFYVI